MELYNPVSALSHSLYRCGELAVAKLKQCAGFCLAAGPAQAFPASFAEIPQEHKLHSPAALAAAKESGRQNSGIVQDQTIALVQILGQFIEMTVLNLSRLFIQMKQPGSVTLFQRGLRDQLLGQIKEKI